MVDDDAIVGKLEDDSIIVPISAVHAPLEALRPPNIIISLPSGPGAQP